MSSYFNPLKRCDVVLTLQRARLRNWKLESPRLNRRYFHVFHWLYIYYTLHALLLPSQPPGRRLMPRHRRPPKKKDCARLTLLVCFSSVGRAPTSATEPSVQLDLQSGTVLDSWNCHAATYIFLERKKNDYCPNVPWSFRLWLTVACLSILPNAVSIFDASYSSHLLLFAVYVLSMNVFSISWMTGC